MAKQKNSTGLSERTSDIILIVITAVVLIVTSMKKSKSTGQPQALGLNYFREER